MTFTTNFRYETLDLMSVFVTPGGNADALWRDRNRLSVIKISIQRFSALVKLLFDYLTVAVFQCFSGKNACPVSEEIGLRRNF